MFVQELFSNHFWKVTFQRGVIIYPGESLFTGKKWLGSHYLPVNNDWGVFFGESLFYVAPELKPARINFYTINTFVAKDKYTLHLGVSLPLYLKKAEKIVFKLKNLEFGCLKTDRMSNYKLNLKLLETIYPYFLKKLAHWTWK